MGVLSRRSPEREQARLERRAAVRARIVAATGQLIQEGENYAALSVETIAARSGISRTTFYDYFPDKRELLLTMSTDVLEDALGDVDDWRPSGDHEETKAELRLIVVGLVQAYHHPAVRAIVEATFYDEAVRDAWHERMERHIAQTRGLMQLERAAGRFPEHGSTLEARARTLHWACHATIFQEIVLRPTIDRDELVDAMVDLCLLAARGVLP
jgi:AcrR family transcriptional regulator